MALELPCSGTQAGAISGTARDEMPVVVNSIGPAMDEGAGAIVGVGAVRAHTREMFGGGASGPA